MDLDKQSVLDYLQGQGLFDQAQSVLSGLPNIIDTSEHAQLLSNLGIDPQQLIEGLGLSEHADAVIDTTSEHVQGINDLTEGGLGGIFDRVTSFLGSHN